MCDSKDQLALVSRHEISLELCKNRQPVTFQTRYSSPSSFLLPCAHSVALLLLVESKQISRPFIAVFIPFYLSRGSVCKLLFCSLPHDPRQFLKFNLAYYAQWPANGKSPPSPIQHQWTGQSSSPTCSCQASGSALHTYRQD